MSVVLTALRGLGQTLITLGIVVLLFCVYELYVTNIYTGQQQTALAADLEQTWDRTPPAATARTPAVAGAPPGPGVPEVREGQPLARLRIPSLGSDYDAVVLEGISTADLRRGPGHYPGSALPGQLGNFVVAGHRTTYGAPFQDFGELGEGDAVVVETRDTWFTYTVRGTEIVSPRRVDVTFPVPGRPDARPTARLLTFTTCHPKYSAKERLVVRAELSAWQAKSAGLPPPLAAGVRNGLGSGG